MRLKKCRKCELDLPLASFSSTMAKYCKKCKIIVRLEQKNASIERQLAKSRKKNKKTKKVDTLPGFKRRAQFYFNRYIRLRDRDNGCISCGTRNSNSWHAGHFWPMGSKGSLRYHEDNCHLQCNSCNTFKHGNLLEYRLRLTEKIGEDKIKWLDDHRNDVKKWTREELNQIIEMYKERVKQIEAQISRM